MGNEHQDIDLQISFGSGKTNLKTDSKIHLTVLSLLDAQKLNYIPPMILVSTSLFQP